MKDRPILFSHSRNPLNYGITHFSENEISDAEIHMNNQFTQEPMPSLPRPLTPVEIEEARASATADLANAVRRARNFRRTSIGVLATGACITLTLSPAIPPEMVHVLGSACSGALEGGLVGALMMCVAESGFYREGALAGAREGAWSGALAGALFGALLGTGAGIFVGMPAAMFAVSQDDSGPDARARHRLSKFAALDAASTGDHCVQYLAWCDSDPDLTEYQNAIGAMGRMPIMLDFETAQSWISNTENKRSAAVRTSRRRAACNRLAAWDGLTN